MADPIVATDVVIQFVVGTSFVTYGCATDLETSFTMETKEVKTVGDGIWKRKRGQSLTQTISLSGVVKNDSAVPDTFDLLDNLKNMVDVEFKILFFDETGTAKTLKGFALPTEVTFSSGSEGFATGSITLVVNGDPDAVAAGGGGSGGGGGTVPPDCAAEIDTAHTELRGTGIQRRWVVIDTMVSGSADITRWDYTLDGGGTQTAFTSATIPAEFILPLIAGPGHHTVVITPVCDNGFSGTPYTLSY
jgi:hypothetical protein